MKSLKKPSFEVYARIVSCVSCEVEANTLEEALEVGRSLTFEDFMTVDSDCSLLDESVAITGAYDSVLNYNTDQQQ